MLFFSRRPILFLEWILARVDELYKHPEDPEMRIEHVPQSFVCDLDDFRLGTDISTVGYLAILFQAITKNLPGGISPLDPQDVKN